MAVILQIPTDTYYLAKDIQLYCTMTLIDIRLAQVVLVATVFVGISGSITHDHRSHSERIHKTLF